MCVIDYEEVVRTYLRAMEAGDLDATIACFDPTGIIQSPVYGDVPVADFYQRLFGDTVKATVRIHTVYCSTADRQRWAAHFAYGWVRKDGATIDTDLVDLFEFGGATGLITRLKIVFDPKSNAGEKPK
jgi:ketosteroid isomerase-like protein